MGQSEKTDKDIETGRATPSVPLDFRLHEGLPPLGTSGSSMPQVLKL